MLSVCALTMLDAMHLYVCNYCGFKTSKRAFGKSRAPFIVPCENLLDQPVDFDSADTVSDFMKRLTPRQQQLTKMRMNGFSYAEIGNAMHEKPSTLRSVMSHNIAPKLTRYLSA